MQGKPSSVGPLTTGKGTIRSSKSAIGRADSARSAASRDDEADGVSDPAELTVLQGFEDEDALMADAGANDEEDADEEDEFLTGSAEVENSRIKGTLGVDFDDVQSDGHEWHESVRASITFRLDGEAMAQRVGHFDLHIIDKVAGDSAHPKLWISSLLRREAVRDVDLAFVCSALQSLYDADGVVLPELAQFADELDTETVVYVSTIRLEPEWRGMGLGPAAVQILHRILPLQCKNEGPITVLLQPDMLREPGNTQAMRKRTQKSLIKFYSGCGYKLWYQQDKKLPCYLLMGRKLEVAEDDESEGVGRPEGGSEDDSMETD
ncbi:hypothetical protein B0A55_03289 [Friedmanniomyces simplex]|uniref:Uncharacterized protein n=1 Tax=Friedmanniomyces simplex TaxID=329884 RepID=A0A4U0XT24_9PEZI|nr:hypothetical protein B0A55_03289 [Friedmanniomyces simplex]